MSDYRSELKEFIQTAYRNQLTGSAPQADQPSWIRTALRPHQLTLLGSAQELETRAVYKHSDLDTPQLLTNYGVLADRVGSGKSLVALALAGLPPPNNSRMVIRTGNGNSDSRLVSIKRMPPAVAFKEEWAGEKLFDLIPKQEGRIHTTASLFIIPHSVCPQWEAYIKDQTNLRAVIVKRTKDCDYDHPNFYSNIFKADVVVVSSTMLKKFIGAISWKGPGFGRIVWSRLFVDEADSIVCTVRYGDISARFTWFISGSWLNMMFPSGLHTFTFNSLPDDVRPLLGNGAIPGVSSRYGFIHSTLSDSRSSAFIPLIIRNNEDWINMSLQTPVMVHDTIVCKTPANLNILHGFISPAAMEALHAGDTAGALMALGLKTASKQTLVDRVTAGLKGDILQAERILEFKKTMDYSTPAVKVQAIEKAEQKVARLREQLASLENRVSSATHELCPICYDTPNTATLTPCCRQTFCLSCLCSCMETKPMCPLCRTPIESVSQLLVIGPESAPVEIVEGPPTKGAALIKLLQESTEDQRYLVFSAHEASFKGLREILSARGIRCELLSGSGARVERLRRQFRDGVVRVLCMNARHVGAGINLEAATHVVLYHRMNTELEKQVIGRAVRFERSAELRVVHLVHEAETALNGASSSEVIVHVD
jgi:hypothetical protein